MKTDSRVSKIYLKLAHMKYLQNNETLKNGLQSTLPSNTTIQATLSGNVSLHLTLNHTTLLFPELHGEPLLPTRKLCDEGCIALSDEKILKIYKNDTNIRQFMELVKSDDLVLK